MGFSNPIVGGASKLIRAAIQSPNYITGVSGWSIFKNGAAEFQSLIVGLGQIQQGALGPGAVTPGTIAAGALDGLVINGVTINGQQINATDLNVSGPDGGIFLYSTGGGQQTFLDTAHGTRNFTVPNGTTSLTVELWAAGAGGGGNGGAQFLISGGAGGGGQYAKWTYAVTPGQVISYTIGQAGAGGSGAGNNGADGGATTFDTGILSVAGGIHGQSGNTGAGGGAGGSGTPPNSPTDAEHGGKGGNGVSGGPSGGGGGGGSGAPGTPGNDGQNGRNPPNSGYGAGGSAEPNGGPGGRGGGSSVSPFNGQTPSSGPGGGGGGAGGDGGGSRAGGAGRDGQLRVTWTPTGAIPAVIIAAAAGTDAFSNAFPQGIMVDGVNGPIVALDPVNGGAESWHAYSLASGWTNAGGQVNAKYKLLPDGNVYTVGSIAHAAFTTTQTILGTAVPTAYRPASRQWVSGNNPGDTSLDVTTNGLFGADIGNLASATTCRWNGIYSLNA